MSLPTTTVVARPLNKQENNSQLYSYQYFHKVPAPKNTIFKDRSNKLLT